MTWHVPVVMVYLALLLPCALLGAHRLWLVWQFLGRRPLPPEPAIDAWPVVTVQLPLFNERHVASRLLAAVGELDYPKECLEIQVLDDSTDDTKAIVDAGCQRLRELGFDAQVVRRPTREGFKAGALAAGLRLARGDVLAVFDADFVPTPEFLRRTVPRLTDGVGMVQARWGHINPTQNWLTEAQSVLLDGHFVVEHAARFHSGRWFNFNGTAGIWRRQAIEDAGGWQHDTLTEDLDLSYRAQMAGWRFIYLWDLVQPAELPVEMAAFKTQQHRWARGTLQAARKLIGPLWASSAPLRIKVDASVHLLANCAHPLTLAIALMLPVSIVARGQQGVSAWLIADALVFALATGSFAVFYAVAVRSSGGGRLAVRLAGLPLALATGIGMSLAQSRAVWLGLFGSEGRFVRTPKWGQSVQSYGSRSVSWVRVGESVLALYLWISVGWAMAEGFWASIPFLGLFAVGFSVVALGVREAPATARISRHAPRGHSRPPMATQPGSSPS